MSTRRRIPANQPTKEARRPRVGEQVKLPHSETIWIITSVGDGTSVNLEMKGTNLDRFRIPASDLIYLDDPSPQKTASHVDSGDITERIGTVERENLDRLDDDIAILTKYLKTAKAPKAGIDALEALRAAQHESWETAMDRIRELIDD